jgi:hypothetical protein
MSYPIRVPADVELGSMVTSQYPNLKGLEALPSSHQTESHFFVYTTASETYGLSRHCSISIVGVYEDQRVVVVLL